MIYTIILSAVGTILVLIAMAYLAGWFGNRDTSDYTVYTLPSRADSHKRFQVLERITLDVAHKGPGEYTAYVSPEDYKFVLSTVIAYGVDPNYYRSGCMIELLGSKVYVRPHRDCPEFEVFLWGAKHVRD